MAGKGLGAVPSFQKVSSGGEFVPAYMSGRLVWSEPNCAVPLVAKSQHCSSSYDLLISRNLRGAHCLFGLQKEAAAEKFYR